MVKRYSKEKINAIKSAIDDALAQGAKPIAAFDADGTLWNTDMGEYFFHYQVKNNLLPNLPKNPLDFYQKLFDQDAKAAFLWLVQINKNRSLTEIKKWTQRAFDEFKNFPVFDDVLEIIHFLQTKKVKIYIVTASMKWAVEPAAKSLGLSADQIIGVTTKIVDELVTDEPEGLDPHLRIHRCNAIIGEALVRARHGEARSAIELALPAYAEMSEVAPELRSA